MRSMRHDDADPQIESALADAASVVDWPHAEGMSARVAARIAGAPRRRQWVALPRFPRLAFAIAAVLLAIVGGALAWAPARDTVADRLGLPGIDITTGSKLPPAGSWLDLGERTTPEEASARAGFRPAPPPDTLGSPQTYLLVNPWGTQITYAYPPSGSLPEVGETGVGLLISQLAGTTNDSFIRKLLNPESTLELVDVGGAAGYWIAGQSHAFVYLAPDGTFHEEAIRLAGNVLIWTRGDVTYRIESALPLDRVIEIARHLEAGR